MANKIAIIGSRDYPVFNGTHPVDILIKSLPPNTVIVTGGAAGVDRLAESFARAYYLPTPQVFTPEAVIAANPGMNYGAACVIRDKQIVDAAQCVFAFWTGSSRGTSHGLRHALATGKPLTVVGMDGKRMSDADVSARRAELSAKGTPRSPKPTPTSPVTTPPKPAPEKPAAPSLFGGQL